jgi:hypothetical protein
VHCRETVLPGLGIAGALWQIDDHLPRAKLAMGLDFEISMEDFIDSVAVYTRCELAQSSWPSRST